MAKKPTGIGYIILFFMGILILANGVLQFSEFLTKYQEQTLTVMFLSALVYMFLENHGYIKF